MFGIPTIGLAVVGLVAVVGVTAATLRGRSLHVVTGAGAAPSGTAAAPRPRHVGLITEALAYLGAVLVLTGAGTAVGEHWDEIGDIGRVAIFAAAAALFLGVGAAVRHVDDPAAARLVDVTWALAVAATGVTAGLSASDLVGTSDASTNLVVGLAVTGCAGALWWLRRHPLQNLALLVGLTATVVGAVRTVAAPDPPALAFALLVWLLGSGWAVLGWSGRAEPAWVAVPSGALLALMAPSTAIEEHGWLYALAFASVAAALVASVRIKSPVLLAMGSFALFAYLTSFVVRYFGDSLGVPAVLALTGILVILLAVGSIRLVPAVRHGQATARTDDTH
jgi:hypothetical protein